MTINKLCMAGKPFSSGVLISSESKGFERFTAELNRNKLVIRDRENFFCEVDGEKEISTTRYGNISYYRQQTRDPYKFLFDFEDESKFYVDEYSFGYGSRWLFQDVEIKDDDGILLGRVRYNNYCLIGPNKAVMYVGDNLDINLSVAILGFFWLKKENSAHDSLG